MPAVGTDIVFLLDEHTKYTQEIETQLKHALHCAFCAYRSY